MPSGESADPHNWRNKRKCAVLTPKQSDEIFFPKPGGKSKAAKRFCADCPVVNKCLEEQLRLGGPGFWAGTTEDERKRMIEFLGLLPSQIDDFIPPVTRPRLRPVRTDPNILGDPLFGLEGPTPEEEFRLLGM